jgi:hypothetical protein
MARQCLILGVVTCLGDAAVVTDGNVGLNEDFSDDKDQVAANLSSVASAEVASAVEVFSDTLFDPEGMDTSVHEAMAGISGKMDLKHAAQVVNHDKLPADVSGLVQTVSDGGGDSDFATQFDEASLDKARIALNSLIEKAWTELDNKIFKCKGFQDMNRNNYGQVTRDIMRLVEQINDLERIESESIEGISQKEQEIQDVKDQIALETKLYNTEYAENKAELTIRQNDLDVFAFILKFTKCKDATAFSQTEARVCEMKSGRKTILYSDANTASKYKTLLTPRAKKSIDQILRSVESESLKGSFLQQPSSNSTTPNVPAQTEPVVGEDGKPCIGAVGQKGGNSGGGGMGDEDECMKSCGPDPPDCALLHDKLSLMWGEYKDNVDQLTMEMMKNQLVFEEMKENLNAQIRMLTVAKARFQQLLAEARANLAADRAEMKEKYKQKAKLNKQYFRYMMQCKKRIQWIMYQDMCAIKVVRNAVLVNSTKCQTDTIMDCDLDAWVKHSCSVSCDDSCDPNQPFKCGGWAKMTRGIVTSPDKCGLSCPLLEKHIRCGQYKCPINCDQSSWSGWSACTADCEGGLKGHTRSIRTKPKNGGSQCGTSEETEPCNTQSCDRNCRLQRWTQWSPCSVACGGGFQERKRHVLIPTRGQGKCPKPSSRSRYTKRQCNVHSCNGDEICVAKQDLVIAVDGSGSVREDGFKILKSYTTTLLKRYQTAYWGQPAMKIGIVLFGNGVLVPDTNNPGKEIVSPAINKQSLTSDMTKVNKAVDDLPFKKGFTNMAQAFSMAEDMFIKGSRKSAQQSVMLITDGKPSFAFMTNEMVEQLDDKNIMRYFVVVNNQGPNSDAMKQMQRWASQPWETNLVHVQGLTMLDADQDLWAEKALTKFCPQAYSPGTGEYQEKIYGYAHVKDSAWCGDKLRANILSKTAADADACAALASGAKAESFMLGAFFRRGWCIKGTMKVDEAVYKAFQADKVAPKCAVGKGWRSSMLYDFYAMQPVAAA